MTLWKDREKEENEMGKIKTGSVYGYQVDVIKVERDGTTHAPETLDFPSVRGHKELAKACVATAEVLGLAQVLPIMPTAVRTVRKWAVDFEDIVKADSFRYTTEPEIISTTYDEDDEQTDD